MVACGSGASFVPGFVHRWIPQNHLSQSSVDTRYVLAAYDDDTSLSEIRTVECELHLIYTCCTHLHGMLFFMEWSPSLQCGCWMGGMVVHSGCRREGLGGASWSEPQCAHTQVAPRHNQLHLCLWAAWFGKLNFLTDLRKLNFLAGLGLLYIYMDADVDLLHGTVLEVLLFEWKCVWMQ